MDHPWDAEVIRSHAEQFSEAGFSARLHREVDDLLGSPDPALTRP